jgi:hypothetical protein
VVQEIVIGLNNGIHSLNGYKRIAALECVILNCCHFGERLSTSKKGEPRHLQHTHALFLCDYVTPFALVNQF